MNPITQILENYKTTVYAKDVQGHVALYDENIHAFDMWGPQWEIKGLKAWHSMVEGWFGSLGSERVVIDMEDVQTKMTENLAFASAYVKYSGVSAEGKTLRWLQNRLTWVLENKNGAWKIIHQHTSTPVDHSTLKASLQR